ncbi:uncharacterized protein F5Z01DRAFT_625626 [Emericellopsis atlantica]|uniref:Zn(2)-C6 fungal-type domain-containing protein n=1 Tax=Emericellopsis atlantica TaxID=2614577 RepID=A0A9P8CM61_9HYPO|nr:uncharacterized protein F5Z01DRAFT_625626 [Emericellopsis atlantica]KAG9252389.1 hypothetical protein F5Z01DRAFT_625626 [Emericellopsis atlantica]
MPSNEEERSRKRPRSTPDTRPAYPRKRAAQACLACRRRRTKCDNERPTCSSCLNLGIECVYQEGDKSSFDSASLAILQRLDATIESLPPLDISVEAVLGWPMFRHLASAHQTPLKTLLQAGSSDSDPRSLITSDIEADDAGSLLQQFLDNFHIYNPVLEISRVKESVRFTRYNGLGWDSNSCLLLLIYALGTIADRYSQPPFETSAAFRQSDQFLRGEAFFMAAQRRMGTLLCKSGIVEAQIFFLAGVYLMTTLRPVEAWKMFVQALACCQGFVPTAHRDAEGQHGDDPRQAESQLHKSIYWTCFKSELELRLELNIAETSVWNLRYPAFFPEPPASLQSQSEAAWYFYLAEIALRRLENRVLTYTCQEQPSGPLPERINTILDFEQQADGWLESLPDTLKLKGSTETPGSADEKHAALRFILNGHLLDCYEMMYWPFMVEAIHRSKYDDDSRLLAIKGFQVCVRRIEENEGGFRLRHHGTWLMLRSCTRSALVLVAASQSRLHSMLPLGWEASVGKVMQMLDYWKEETWDAADRLEILETMMRVPP